MLKLVYFDARGLVENARIMLKISDIDFEEERLPLKFKENGAVDSLEFDAIRTTGVCVVNMDRVPLLYVDGVAIGQSKTIERYVAKRTNMLGSSDVEAAQIDCITEHIRDIKDKFQKVKSLPAAEKEEGMKKWFDTDFGEWIVKLEKSLPSNRSPGCSVGSAMSYADICIWNLLTDYFDNSVTTSYAGCESITGIVASVSANERLKAYLAVRPVTFI